MRKTIDTGFFVAAVLLAGGLSACGGNEHYDPLPPPDRPDARVPGDGGGDMPDGAVPFPDAAVDPAGPLVEILTPTEPAAGDYSAAAILTSARFTVSCRVRPNPDTGTLVDSSSVTISALGSGQQTMVAARPSGEPDVFLATLALDEFPSGKIAIQCEASDTAEEPRTNSDTIATYLDQGPRIEILMPENDESYANQLEVLFSVVPEKVADDDDVGSALDPASVELFIAGKSIPGVSLSGTVYSASIAFNDPIFDAPLLGEQVVRVTAMNARGQTSEETVVFRIDSGGPLIEVVSPQPGQLVAGIMRLTVTITDDVGIEPSTVIATIAGVHQFLLDPVDESTFIGDFDTRILTNMVFPAVVVRAQDALGNQSSFGMVVALDNVAPLMSLDSPKIREGKYKNNDIECSELFDPLGDDAANDGSGLAQLSEIRARIEDRPNIATASSSIVIPKAGVDETTVELFILDNEADALIVDSNGDGICDMINPHLIPTSIPTASNEVARLDMAAIEPTGSAHFTSPSVPYDPAPSPDSICVVPQPAQPPAPLCRYQSTLTRVIPDGTGQPAIYSVPPILQGQQCLGNAFDSVASNISDGWACAAVQAHDHLGNLGVSPPLRVCLDREADPLDGDNCPAPGAVQSTGLPDCTGTYDPVTDTVNAGQSCIIPARDRFVAKEVRIP